MKKLLITIAILTASITLKAQQHLPAKVKIELTEKQVMRIDSAINMASNQIDSKQFTLWFGKLFEPIYSQLRQQLVTDTVKKVKKP
jgi:hypothetical protein